MAELGLIDDPLPDVEVAQLWAASGAQWLTSPHVDVPGALVRRVRGLVTDLDRRGAGLGDLVAASGVGLLAERAAVMHLPAAGEISAGGASRVLRAADGWFVVSLTRPDDEDLVPAWLESACDSPSVWSDIERAVATRAVADLVDRATLLGLPCAGVGEPITRSPVVSTQLGSVAPRALEGCVVVNLASLWAGPLAADVLARLGARVITVESTRRPDGARMAPRFFAALHGRTESAAFDLADAGGRRQLHDLLRGADVVVEGSRPRALLQMGIEAEELVRGHVRAWVSITAHGRHPGSSGRVGFGDDAAAAGGLVGWSGRRPQFIADAVADPLTGLTAALVAVELLERGGRWLADVALAAVARAAVGGWTERVAASERPRPRRDPGARLPLGRDTDAIGAEFGLP